LDALQYSVNEKGRVNHTRPFIVEKQFPICVADSLCKSGHTAGFHRQLFGSIRAGTNASQQPSLMFWPICRIAAKSDKPMLVAYFLFECPFVFFLRMGFHAAA